MSESAIVFGVDGLFWLDIEVATAMNAFAPPLPAAVAPVLASAGETGFPPPLSFMLDA